MGQANQNEAIKLISDWSKWIVTIETAAIAAIGAFAKGESPVAGDLRRAITIEFATGIACFVVSIGFAAYTLLSLPASLQDIELDQKIWDRVAAVGPFKPKTYFVAGGQFVFFLIGLLLFGLGVATTLFAMPLAKPAS